MVWREKTAGISQFQRPMTIRPNNPMATMAMTMNFAIRFGRIALLLFIEEFVDLAQAPPQVHDGVVLAGDQSVDVHAAFGGQLLETAALQLVGDEDRALLFRQLIERSIELVEQHAVGVGLLRTGVRGGENLFQQPRLALRHRRLRSLPAKAVDNAVAGHAEE